MVEIAPGTTLQIVQPGLVVPLGVVKGDTGPPGAPGGSDASFAAWVNDATPSATRAAITSLPVPAANLTGTVPNSVLPPLAISETYPVASQAAMLALTAQRGDVAIRSDLNKSFILSTDSPSTLADWKELLTPTDAVTSVAGKVGVVSLVKADITDLGAIGTAAALNVPASGDAASGEVVKGSDSRMANSRTPTAHTHVKADITDLGAIGTAAAKNTGTASGDVPLLGAGGVLPIARVATGTPDGTKFVRDDGTLAVPAGGGGGGGLLASVSYDPATVLSVDTTSATFVAIDTTNLSITFTAPASGNVMLKLSGVCFSSTTGTGYWCVTSGGTIVPQSRLHIGRGTDEKRPHYSTKITGLTPSTSYTWKWCHRSGSATFSFRAGQNGDTGADRYGSATMEVWSA